MFERAYDMKSDRKKAILDIVSKYEVDTQETLQALLMERGFNVTQATVSRDIKELSLLKTMGVNGSYKYTLPPKSAERGARSTFNSLFADAVVSVDSALNTIVIKCSTGMANAVCSKLDNVGYTEIVGTLAGDDTIFVIMRTESDAANLCEELLKLL